MLKGSVGSRNLDVVPPNPGSEAVAVLYLHDGGDTYCASFGGAAGGIVNPNTATVFKVRAPTAQPTCPPLPAQVCCDSGPALTCGWAESPDACASGGGRVGDGGTVCDGSGLCSPPPATAGSCCEIDSGFGTNCVGGPGLAPFCTDLGGTLFASAVCQPGPGSCASPSGAFVEAVGPF